MCESRCKGTVKNAIAVAIFAILFRPTVSIGSRRTDRLYWSHAELPVRSAVRNLGACAWTAGSEVLAPYYETPEMVVDRMLQLGNLRPGEKMYDLGSGDGRIVVMAAQKYKADATGVELDRTLVKQSTKHIRN